MSIFKRPIVLLAFVVALLIGAVYFIVPPGEKTNLGLDLQGGLAVILEAKDTPNAPRTQDGMSQAVSIIQDRVNGLGVAEPEIQRQGTWKISVQLPGVADSQKALDIIGKTAVLEFWDVSQFGKSYPTQAEALKAAKVASVDKLPKGTRLIHWPAAEGSGTDSWFVVEAKPKLSGSALTDAKVGFDQNNQPKVDMTFNSEGAKQFAELTDSLAQKSQVLGQDQLLAIVLDNVVESAPRVQERIDGGQAEISGSFTLDEAKQLALVLKTGALPIELTVVQQNTIGATLGKASLNQALFAGAVGMILIMLFMLVVYRLMGLVADIALLIYGVLFWAILNAIGVTLTLPGIAGAILTLGVALDANVIIFARIREEVKGGKSLRTATDVGFRKAFRAIFDSNMTTLLTAAILFFTAVGGVRGFALTLGIGVLLSMFTAVLVTRALLTLLAGFRPFQNPSLLGLNIGQGHEMKVYPFMRYTKYYLAWWGVVVVFAVVSILAFGLTSGIDFKGGVRVQVQLQKPASTNDVAAVMGSVGVKDPVVQQVGDNIFQVTADEISDAQYQQSITKLDQQFGASAAGSGIERVGPSFGADTTSKALMAVALAMLGVVAYLSLRFEFKMAVAAVLVLTHDVGLTLGVYAVTGIPVTSATIAAVLTVLGYSVMDTIIVFDRMRENTLLMKKEAYADMANLSVRQVMARSLNTSLLTLIPITCILLFGGLTLKDFAFALFIGIIAGTYSSLFIATPFVVLWKEREPRYRKRLAMERTA